ncbi:CBS domain-containing protein [Streptococcus chenjunshii]|uniref:CBS domain-containing protein n=1 Tax=Streptococcus chenjunshii TaxID=2173853 RepID=A0A372KM82_9STRE|nr:CBS and ACT domain-containing protein [Streptococcus chenjunshii]AXQ79165.1 CBS domain-containing protein [Streptococcus chenjunshii]RFU50998.1 CBS domain-containing protein [Streptococcus chenjunshii]RFU53392.1 CBS domain-containing protein [Streptococcus chenjunshii]
MPVKDFMTKKVVYVSPDTTVAAAADIMREQDLRRLPVIENDHLVGLVTAGTMAEASPSKASSLSIYEMNYLLNKTKIGDIMIKDVVTVSQYARLEDAIYIMMKHSVGILPVVDNGQIYGVITDKDVFRAFLEVSGYGEEGVRAVILADDSIGVLAKVVDTITDENLNIKHTVIASRKSGKTVIEVQIDGQVAIEDLKAKLLNQGIEVESIEKTAAKSLK